jgi:hypothetical protein
MVFTKRVLELSRSLRPQFIVTTDEVLTELLTFSATDRQLRLEASLVVHDVLADENVRVVPQTPSSPGAANSQVPPAAKSKT